ncbi:MAG: ATP-binding cassette domain-containing protein [Burkholderiales bacterium]|jgi:ATP-binding cassette subfamily F protein 3|nr:ATP-binding cassette domain-containing protein [Burkholderiales bacterium]
MIRLDCLTLMRGARVLLEDTSLTIHARQRVGIIGANGCGKSSLFALLKGEILAERGDIFLPPRAVLAHVAQETPSLSSSALAYVLDGDRELREIENAIVRLQQKNADDHGQELAEWHHRYEAIGGYAARARASELLAGLGFAHREHERSVDSFSGGWRMRLNLAQALMCRSDVLLLDEPTNHLDLDAVIWLEDWLRRYPGMLLLITHDRDFLDNVVNTIVHFERQTLKSYRGNYAQFERERAIALANQQATYEKQQRTIAHMQRFIDRFRAKATKAKQAQSRLKQLEKMTRISAAHIDNPFSFSFSPSDAHSKQLLRIEQGTLGYRDSDQTKTVLTNVECSILSDTRIGLLGVNGAGKSTLIKSLTAHLPLLSGTRHVARDLRIGYFAQHQLDTLDPEASALLHLQRIDPQQREPTLRNFLGGFAFHGDHATRMVASFSGGERARLALALIVYQRPQLLILDEPTNHLDINMREALIEALQEYNGALLVVAHDRYLLSATVDVFWLVDQETVTPFDGDLDDYRERVLSRARAQAAPQNITEEEPAITRKEQKRQEAEIRRQRAPLIKKQKEVETQLERCSAELAALERWMASPEAYHDDAKTQLAEILKERSSLTQYIERLEKEWLTLAETAERISDTI